MPRRLPLFLSLRRLPVRLIETGAAIEGNDGVNTELADRYGGRPYEGLQLHRKTFDVDHFYVGKPSFDWAIDLLD